MVKRNNTIHIVIHHVHLRTIFFVFQSAGDNINAVATSYRGDSASGYSYGSYQAGVLHEYNLLTNAYEENKLFTCLEVKCPMEPVFNDSVTLPPDYEPAVFVEGTINTDESCANLT